MRLIDADKLIEDLQSQIQFGKYPPDSMGAMVNLVTLLCIDKIKEEPTAYDIDKVVQELEKSASRYTKKYNIPSGGKGYKDVKAISVNKAIEIVKRGGLNE